MTGGPRLSGRWLSHFLVGVQRQGSCSTCHPRPPPPSPPISGFPVNRVQRGRCGGRLTRSPTPTLGVYGVWKRAVNCDQNQGRIFKEALTGTLRKTSEFNSRKKCYQGKMQSSPTLGERPANGPRACALRARHTMGAAARGRRSRDPLQSVRLPRARALQLRHSVLSSVL